MAAEQTRPVVVMGGGPAGVFSACGLIDLGIPVTLITRSRPFPAWEGLSERPRASLCHFGFERTLKSLGPMVARTAHWNGVSTIQNREYIVERRRFDQALLEDAAARGVEIVQGRIEQVSHHDGNWHISCRTAHGQKNFSAAFLVDARGREARLGRKFPGSDVVTAPATAAVLKSYQVSQKLSAMTSVATFTSGWAWYLRDGNGRAILQIFVDGGRGNLPGKAGLEAYFSRLVKELPEAAAWLDGARAEDKPVSVRTAAATMTLPVGGQNFLVVGDGSLALDPLSGNGIFYAIGSGLAAGPVINSLINRPQDGELALEFYRARIEQAFTGGCRSAREFYAAEQRWPEAPFWRVRRHWPPAVSPADPLPKPVEFAKKPVVKNGFISTEDVIVTADYPRGVWQVDGVPLVRLLNMIRADDGGSIFPGATAAQTATARKWLLSQNIID